MSKLSLEKIKENKSFCMMAWCHHFLDATGRAKPCCRFRMPTGNESANIEKTSIDEIFHSPLMTNVRQKMLKGESIDGCIRCYEEEQAGKTSLRQRHNSDTNFPIDKMVDLQTPQIKWLELAISNECNLACRMCDSRYSSKWYDEEKLLFGESKNKSKFSKFDVDKIFPLIPHLTHLKFTGGEPLMTKDHWVFIQKLVEHGSSKNISINYSTNCTINPKKEWIDLWDQFQFKVFALSFDSSNPFEAEYIRWPSKFEKIETVTKEFLKLNCQPKYRVSLRSTVSLLNVWGLPETILWWLENDISRRHLISPTHLTFPNFLSITVLPPAAKKMVSQKYHKILTENPAEALEKALIYILTYMNSKDDTHLLPQLETYIEKTDAFRKQNFFLSYPQFSTIFEKNI